MLKGKGGGWLGNKKEEAQPEFKVSAWAAKAEEVAPSGMKFAQLDVKHDNGYGRKEQ